VGRFLPETDDDKRLERHQSRSNEQRPVFPAASQLTGAQAVEWEDRIKKAVPHHTERRF
jgi:hypothetical protein